MTDSTNEDTSPHPSAARVGPGHLNWTLRMADEHVGAVLVLLLGGRISAAEAGLLQARLEAAVTAGNRRLVLDLAGVDYVSSRGLAVLEAASSRLQAGDGVLVLCEIPDAVRIVLELTGLNERLAIEGTRAGAIERAAGPGGQAAQPPHQSA